MVQTFTDTLRHMPMNVSSSGRYNTANIFLGLLEYELNSLLGASRFVDYISVHIRFDLERYLLNNSDNEEKCSFTIVRPYRRREVRPL